MATTTWTQTAGMVSDEDVDNLESYAEQALASKNAAAESETNAATSETNAATSATNASVSASSAATSAANAATSATNASTSETNASTSATSASTSATAASASATAAAASETAAAASETAAAASETAAAASETAAASSETNAASSATSAATSATAAAASEASVATNATAAATSATNAATSETNAATSETNAATSETNAATSATAAASSATAAASSASSASTSASAASSAQTAAESARDATLAAYDNFDDRYLGAKSSAPTVDNDGNALVAGALYFDSTAGAMKVYTGSAWVAAYVSGTDYLPFSGGTMTGDVGHNDGVKATFGASNDLEIYHDGSASYIEEKGTGSLYIKGTQLRMQATDGTTYLEANDGGALVIKHGGTTKFTTTSGGIDVTGTVVSDGLTVDGNVLATDASNNRVGINQGSPSTDLQISHPANNTSTLTPSVVENLGLRVRGESASNTTGDIYSGISLGEGYAGIYGYDGGASAATGLGVFTGTNADVDKRITVDANGDISFYEDTGTNAKFRWDASAERLGIGTTSPSTALDVAGTATVDGLTVSGTSTFVSVATFGSLVLNGATTYNHPTSGTANLDWEDDYLRYRFGGSGTPQGLRIDDYDDIKIKLNRDGSAYFDGAVEINGWTITESGGSLYFATGGTNKMKLDASGNLDVVGSVNSNATIT